MHESINRDFASWQRPNLERLARDLLAENNRQGEQIAQLKGDLATALQAYRDLNKTIAPANPIANP